MRAGQVLMRSPKGRIEPVDSSEVQMFTDAGFEVVRKPAGGFKMGSPEAQADLEQRVVEAPGAIRRGIGASLPVLAATGAGALMGGPAGAGGGFLRGLGGLAVEGLAASAAKVPGSMLEKGRLPTPGEVALEGGATALSGGIGRALKAGVARAPRPTMKAAIGNAPPGMEDEFLRRSVHVSNEGLAAANAEIKAATDASQAAIDASPKLFDWRVLRRSVRGLQKGAEKSDLASRATEKALKESLGILTEKIGPKVTTTPASTILAPGRGVRSASPGPAVPSVTTTQPAKPLTARDLEKIRDYSDNKAKGFHKVRAENNDKVVGTEEQAHIDIARTARRMLASIPEVRAARALESAAIRRQKVIFAALKRAPNQQAALMGAGALGLGAGYGGDPLLGLPGMVLGYGVGRAASSPAGLSAAANLANRPLTKEAVRHLPRALQLFVEESGALGGQ